MLARWPIDGEGTGWSLMLLSKGYVAHTKQIGEGYEESDLQGKLVLPSLLCIYGRYFRRYVEENVTVHF